MNARYFCYYFTKKKELVFLTPDYKTQSKPLSNLPLVFYKTPFFFS